MPSFNACTKTVDHRLVKRRCNQRAQRKRQTRFAESLDTFSSKIWQLKRISKRYKYDLAILVSGGATAALNKGALLHLKKPVKTLV